MTQIEILLAVVSGLSFAIVLLLWAATREKFRELESDISHARWEAKQSDERAWAASNGLHRLAKALGYEERTTSRVEYVKKGAPEQGS